MTYEEDDDDVEFNGKTLSTGGDAATTFGASLEVLNNCKKTHFRMSLSSIKDLMHSREAY